MLQSESSNFPLFSNCLPVESSAEFERNAKKTSDLSRLPGDRCSRYRHEFRYDLPLSWKFGELVYEFVNLRVFSASVVHFCVGSLTQTVAKHSHVFSFAIGDQRDPIECANRQLLINACEFISVWLSSDYVRLRCSADR